MDGLLFIDLLKGHLDVVRYLLTVTVQMEATDHMGNPLHLACCMVTLMWFDTF